MLAYRVRSHHHHLVLLDGVAAEDPLLRLTLPVVFVLVEDEARGLRGTLDQDEESDVAADADAVAGDAVDDVDLAGAPLVLVMVAVVQAAVGAR